MLAAEILLNIDTKQLTDEHEPTALDGVDRKLSEDNAPGAKRRKPFLRISTALVGPFRKKFGFGSGFRRLSDRIRNCLQFIFI